MAVQTDMKKRRLYDWEAPNRSTAIINGRSSNVLNWDDCRFPWAYKFYKNMLANFWTPFEINMTKDKKQWETELSENERGTFLKIIGLLAFLDSIQTDYSGRAADYLTDSSLVALMQTLSFQEVVHNQSYSYVLSSLVNKSKQEEIFEYWKHDPILRKRNGFIAEGYEVFIEKPTPENFLKSIVYDVVLEGLFFYCGFAFFYNLARNQKMVSSSTMINYINRDEHQHVRLFTSIYKGILNENPELDTPAMKDFAAKTLREAAELEMEWGRAIIGNKFDSISCEELEAYIKFIVNIRAKQLGLSNIYEGFNKNPLRWITIYEDVNLGKTDFFEQKSRQYSKVSADNGFDEL